MRLGGLVIALVSTLAACHGQKVDSPAWPAASTTADDGGESLEPRPTSVASAVESSGSDEEEPAAVTDDVKPAAAPATPDTPGAAAPTGASPQGEVIMSDEIIIEIDD